MDRPRYRSNLHARGALENPLPHFKAIRDLGSAVWLPRARVWAVARYEDVRRAVTAPDVLISGEGISLNPLTNKMTRDKPFTVTADGADHKRFRTAVQRPIRPKEVKALKPRLKESADRLVDALIARSRFDGVRDFAEQLPVTIVKDLVGAPPRGRDNMLKWSRAAFDAVGPLNLRTLKAIPLLRQMQAYGYAVTRANASPDGWMQHLFDARDEGTLHGSAEVANLVMDYIGPALDTTIAAISHMLHLLGEHPEAYERLRKDPSLVRSAMAESLRLATPISGFTRIATEDFSLGEGYLKKGERALMYFAAANRDERKWDDPESFRIDRDPRDHLAFGFGLHTCAGRHLAEMEMECLLEALIERVTRIEVGPAKLIPSNTLRGLTSFDATFRTTTQTAVA